MAIASGLRATLAYVKENVLATTPTTPTLTRMRATSRNVNLNKNLLESAEVSSHGEETDVRHGFNKVEGTIGGELLTDAWDDWIAAGLGGVWSSAIDVDNVAIGITAPATITRGSGDFVADGIKVGDVIVTSGFTAPVNNGKFFVIAMTTTTITVATLAAGLTTEASSGSRYLNCHGHRCDIGLTQTSFSVERSFGDLTKYQPFLGVVPGTMAIGIQPEKIIDLSWNVMGVRASAMSGSSLTASPLTEPAGGSPYDSFVGDLILGSTIQGVVTGMNINVNLQRSTQAVVGSKYTPDIFEGRRQIGGDLNALFQNETIYNAFINETENPVGMRMDDPDGVNFQAIYMPRVKLTGAPMDPGQTGPIVIASPFRALRHATRGTTLTWFRSNVDA